MRTAISLVILLLFSSVLIYDVDADGGRSTNHSVDIPVSYTHLRAHAPRHDLDYNSGR